MAETSKSYAAFGPKQALKEWTFDLHPLGPDDIEIKVTYSGICHSDIHTIKGEWGDKRWPIVPGHEIVGYITKLGSNVKQFHLGQRVGVGAQANSCLKCSECKLHQEPYCLEGFTGTYGDLLEDGYITKGGYAEYHRARAHFAVAIPDEISSAEAAPLMCAGITTYAPLKFANIGPGKKVGVIGIGGLGHVGLKLARALGAHVVAISSSPSKKQEALNLGAHEFINHQNDEELKGHKQSFDLIMNSVSAPLDYEKIFKLAKPHGVITNLGLPEEPIKLSALSFGRHVSFNGTSVGSPSQIAEMLQLCVQHNIRPQIELTPLTAVNEAIEKVLRNEARYRIVLVVDKAFEEEQLAKKSKQH